MGNPPSSKVVAATDKLSSKLIFCSHETLCGDAQKIFRSLHLHSKKSGFPLLAKFLFECTAILRAEVLKLPYSLRLLLQPFQSILYLVTVYDDIKDGPLGLALKNALLCTLSLGIFIGHYEADKIEYVNLLPISAVSGLGIGLFAAAAISISSSLSELAFAGAESVRIAFRLGIHIDQVSQLLDLRETQGEPKPWAYRVIGVSVEDVRKEVEVFNSETQCPEISKINVSYTSKQSVVVTGPPSRLEYLFRRSRFLQHSEHSPLADHGGLYPSLNVYKEDDVKAISSALDVERCGGYRALHVSLSSRTGASLPAHTATDLFELICKDVLMKPQSVDTLAGSIVENTSAQSNLKLNVIRCCTSAFSEDLISDIESKLPMVSIINHDLGNWIDREFCNTPLSMKDSKLAVVGMSCRMPGGAADIDLFFDLMVNGRDAHTKIPVDRFDVNTHCDPTGRIENASETPFGNFIENPGFFDAGFFNMSPREAEQTDPMHRLALVTAYEALEMAGYSPNRTTSTNVKRVGTFYGVASDDYREVNAGQNIGTYGTPGGERAFANGRINYFFGFGGPSFNIDTACSSSGAAINAACSSLLAGEVDSAIAGGLNIITNPDNYSMLSKGHFLSKTGQCKVWDMEADGYCRADGIGSIVIKRLDDAQADNDNIIAVISAAATNHSAEAISITHPHVGAQKYNYNQVMQHAGVSPLEVSYVELHGTGTQAGDGVESESVAEVFAPTVTPRHPENPLYLGAVKANIGHGEAAAGVASMIKVLLAYQRNQIPRNIGIRSSINPVVEKNIRNRNASLVTENTPWPRRKGVKRYAIVNSFGAHGGNTTFLLEDAPETAKTGKDPRPVFVVAVSAKSTVSLRGNIEGLLSYLDQNPDTDLGDLSYTSCSRRIHHHIRVATSASTITQVRQFLTACTEKIDNLRPVHNKSPSVAFAFTGQGAFYEGIGLQLFRDFPPFQEEVVQLDQVLRQLGFPSVVPVIRGPIRQCSKSTLITQLTIVVIEIALVKFWELMGIRPNVVIGHSLGEYAALFAAGVLSAADALFLVGKRAELIMATCKIGSHAMLSVRAGVETIQRLSKDHCYEVACINCNTDTVISGSQAQIDGIREAAERNGLRCTQLDIPFAFHSSQLDPMLDSFEELARNVPFRPPRIPIISPLLRKCIFDGETVNAKYLRRSSREPVNFLGGLEAARSIGITDTSTVWIDNGPHPVCRAFINSHAPSMNILPTFHRNDDNFATITSTVAKLYCEGVSIYWDEMFRPYEKAHRLLHWGSYKWNEKNYWIPYQGTWTLDKAHTKTAIRQTTQTAATSHPSLSSSVQQIVWEDFQDSSGQLVAVSDVMQPEFLGAVNGHRMNHQSVATTSIWVDMAFTIGEYLYKGLAPGENRVSMNISKMQVLQATVVQRRLIRPMLVHIEARIDLMLRTTSIQWFRISEDGVRCPNEFASAKILYEDSSAWETEWRRTTHLLNSRIDALSRMAFDGTANKLLKGMVYSLYGNVVDYAESYRGMQSVVLHGYEAFADITLNVDRHGEWHTPPHWIDSVLHIAGFVANCSDLFNSADFFCLTPGFTDLRLAKRLEPGGKYRSYVRIFPVDDGQNIFTGDIFVLQDRIIIGLCFQMKFKRIPRSAMNMIFSPPAAPTNSATQRAPPQSGSAISSFLENSMESNIAPQTPFSKFGGQENDSKLLASFPGRNFQQAMPPTPPFSNAVITNAAVSRHTVPPCTPNPTKQNLPSNYSRSIIFPASPPQDELIEDEFVAKNLSRSAESAKVSAPSAEKHQVTADCMKLIAEETGFDMDVFRDEVNFTELGVDSLMSLVLIDKLRNELGVVVQSSVFLEFPTVRALKAYLENYF